MYYQYQTPNVEVRKFLLKYAQDIGAKIDYYFCKFEKGAFALIDDKGFGFDPSGSRGSYKDVSFEEFLTHLNPEFKPIKVKLNDEYTAEVQKDGSVAVGCQTFTANAIEELFEAVSKVIREKA